MTDQQIELLVEKAKSTITQHLIWAGLSPQLLTDLLAQCPEFETAPASLSKHHVYPGGLIVHTAEVMDNIVAMHISTDDKLVLITAALFHDLGKTIEYSKDPKTAKYRSLIGHVVGSTYLFMNFVMRTVSFFFGPNQLEAITHCMLSHHGKLEWGAAVLPQTSEAFLLHRADMQSAFNGPNAQRKDQ